MSTFVSIGYDERNASAFSDEMPLTEDTRPGEIVPIPVGGPSFAVKVRHLSLNDFDLSGVTLYFQRLRMTA